MRHATPLIVLIAVGGLLAGYGRFSWSWLAGPVAAVAVFALQRATAPAEDAARADEPSPVD